MFLYLKKKKNYYKKINKNTETNTCISSHIPQTQNTEIEALTHSLYSLETFMQEQSCKIYVSSYRIIYFR